MANIIPRHVGIIMDGNGRWAKKRLLPRAAGHRAGMTSMINIVRAADEAGVQALTVYALSTENWSRPTDEVSALMKLAVEYCTRELDNLMENNVRMRMFGDWAQAGEAVDQVLQRAVSRTAGNTGLQLNIAFGYGARAEIARAARLLAEDVAAGKIAADEIDEQAIANRLYTADMPELDLIIRTGGDVRLSNFLLYQAAYAELYFTPILWPDFDKQAFTDALQSFTGRNRRYGQVTENS